MILDLPSRAKALGISAAELVALGYRDPRITAQPSTDRSEIRLRRWIAAGSPEGDLARIEYQGDDGVRALVCDVLCRLPAPARHYAIEAVTWFEVGRGTAAWIYRAPPMRALRGDAGHVIAINGRVRDEDLRGVLAHEVSHGWHRPVIEIAMPLLPLSEREVIAARYLFAKYTGGTDQASADRDLWIRACVENELLADRQAEAWGVPNYGPGTLQLRRHYASEYDAAAGYADLADRRAAAIEGAHP